MPLAQPLFTGELPCEHEIIKPPLARFPVEQSPVASLDPNGAQAPDALIAVVSSMSTGAL